MNWSGLWYGDINMRTSINCEVPPHPVESKDNAPMFPVHFTSMDDFQKVPKILADAMFIAIVLGTYNDETR